MPRKKVDPKAKAKRQKIIAAVGAVLLLGLLAIQGPRTMKMLNQKPPEQPVPVAAPTSSDPSVLPTPGSAGGSTSAPSGSSSGNELISSDLAPSPQAGQLVAFGRFESKDPFKQQVDPDRLGGSSDGGSSSSVSASSGGDKKQEPAPAAGGGVVSTGGSPHPTPTTSSVPAGSARISVNGTEEQVAVKAGFPAAEPVFTLVSLSKAGAKVAIAGGAFASGQPTLTLKVGKPISLVNTADGTRYELKLVAVG